MDAETTEVLGGAILPIIRPPVGWDDARRQRARDCLGRVVGLAQALSRASPPNAVQPSICCAVA